MATPRAQPGFGPKSLFFDVILPHFQSNARRLASSALGAACEAWINTECFHAIREARPELWVRPEAAGKKDLVLFSSPEAEEASAPSLVIESKVLYVSYTPSEQAARLGDLARQLGKASAEYPLTPAVGLVTTFDWEYRRDGGLWAWERPDKSSSKRFEKTSRFGLENAFGQDAGRWVIDGYEVGMSSYTFRISAKMEMLRLASQTAP